jgi:hypothetical protein
MSEKLHYNGSQTSNPNTLTYPESQQCIFYMKKAVNIYTHETLILSVLKELLLIPRIR